MGCSVKTSVALVTDNALVALDLTATIAEVFPWAEVIKLKPPFSTDDALSSRLLALIVEQPQAKSMDLDRIRSTGTAVVVIGEGDPTATTGLAYLPMPFTTEMLTSVLSMVPRPEAI